MSGGMAGFGAEDTGGQVNVLNTTRLRSVGEADLFIVERDPTLPAAGLTQTVRPGLEPGHYEVVFHISNADGILGMELDLGYDAKRIAVLGVETREIADPFSIATNDDGDRVRMAMFSTASMQGSGEMLVVEIEALTDEPPVAPFVIDAQANEGQIPLRIQSLQRDEPRDRGLGSTSGSAEARLGRNR